MVVWSELRDVTEVDAPGAEGTGWRRAGASCGSGDRNLTRVHGHGCVLEGGQDVVPFEVGVVGEQVVDGSPAGKLAEHRADRDAKGRRCRARLPFESGRLWRLIGEPFEELDPDLLDGPAGGSPSAGM